MTQGVKLTLEGLLRQASVEPDKRVSTHPALRAIPLG